MDQPVPKEKTTTNGLTAHLNHSQHKEKSYPVDFLQTGGGQSGQCFVVQLQWTGANVLERKKKWGVSRSW